MLLILKLGFIYYGLQLLLGSLCIIFWKRMGRVLRIFSTIIWAGIVNQIFMEMQLRLRLSYSNFFNGFTILESIGWCILYYFLFNSPLYKKMAIAALFIFVASCAAFQLGGYNLFANNSYTVFSFESFIIIGLSLLFLWEIYSKSDIEYPYKLPEFWIISGNLLFYGVTWIIMTTHHIISVRYPAFSEELFNINRVANIVRSLTNLAAFLWILPVKKHSY